MALRAHSLSMTAIRANRRTPPVGVGGYRWSPTVTIRWAAPADASSVAMLAGLDEASVPPAPQLLAFVDDELWVALSLSTGALISDPFRPSAEVAALVLERGRQLTVAEIGRPRSGVMRFRDRFRAPRKFGAATPPRLGEGTS
jgi:hypothetical protein